MGWSLSQAGLNRQGMEGMEGMVMGEEAMEKEGKETMDTILSDVDSVDKKEFKVLKKYWNEITWNIRSLNSKRKLSIATLHTLVESIRQSILNIQFKYNGV